MSVTILTFFRAVTSKAAEEKILKMFQAEEAAGGEAAQCVEGNASSRPSQDRGNGTERKLEEPVIWRRCWDSGT